MILKSLVLSFLINLFVTITKIIVSFISGSSTLLADAVHSFSDMLTDIVSLVGAKLSNKKPDKDHPFGHGKIEYVTSMILSLFIIVMGVSIIISSFETRQIYTNIIPIIVLIVTIIIKLLLSTYLLQKGKEYKSDILISNGTETRYDVLSTSVALIFVLLSYISKYNNIFKYADFIGSLVISILTIRIGIKLFIKNTRSVIGEIETNKKIINETKKLIENNKLYKIKRLTMIKNGTYYEVIVDLLLDKNLKLNKLYKIENNIKKKLKEKEYIKYVTINMHPLS